MKGRAFVQCSNVLDGTLGRHVPHLGHVSCSCSVPVHKSTGQKPLPKMKQTQNLSCN